MAATEGTIYPTNKKGTWVIIEPGATKAIVTEGKNRDEAARKFFESRNMRMVKARKKK